MTKTIKEIEEKFYEKLNKGLKECEKEMKEILSNQKKELYEIENKRMYQAELVVNEKKTFDEETKEKLKEIDDFFDKYINDIQKKHGQEIDLKRKKSYQKILEKVLLNFLNNDDDFVTAFAGYITFVIKLDLITDDTTSYETFFNLKIDEILTKDCELKYFLKEFSSAICNNDYNKIQLLYDKYDYSIISAYIFCYYMYIYSQNIENSNVFNILISIYRKMNDDILNYVLNLGIYEIMPDNVSDVFNDLLSLYGKKQFNILNPFQLFPFCYIYSKEYWAKKMISLENELTSLKEQSNNSDNNKFSIASIIHNGLNNYLKTRVSEQKVYAIQQIIENDLCQWSYEPINRNDRNKMHTLHIPTILPNMNLFKKLLKASAELEQTNISLMKSQENRKKILNSFSHRYKNMKTNSLYKVANALLKMDSKELKKHGRTVLLEYGIKENLKKEVDILQLQFEDNIDILKEKIQNSTQQQPSQDNFSILEIINNVIKKCIITLVHDGGDEPKAIRKFCFKDYDLISIRNSFEENVLFEENINPVTWFKENIAHNFKVNISPFWKEIFFKKHDYADNVISDLLTDMLMNALKYADKTQNIQFDLDEDDNFMIIRSRNTTVKDKTNIPSSGIGLESQNDLLNVLNKAETNLNNSITFGEADGIFSIEVRISKNLVRRNKDV